MREKRELSESDITKHTWGFEWDDIEKAAKEMRESTFGPDGDVPTSEKFCFECGESSELKSAEWCEFCGYGYDESRKARQFMARHIDVAWPLMNVEERDSFKKVMKGLRLVSPEFRQMWKKEADQASLNRRYENG